MIPKFDLHTHTVFCDGKNTPEEMVSAAIEKKFDILGISGHSYTSFDGDFCMSEDGTKRYIEEISRLKQKYRGKINLYLGCERDYFSDEDRFEYDYVIGSVHYVKRGGEYLSVDDTAEKMCRAVEEYYGGSYFEYARDYFELAADCPKKTNADIIGHFDLVTKFNEGNRFFDEDSARYKSIAIEAAEAALRYGKPFEVNVGAIYRSYKTEPYPNGFLLDFIRENGGAVTVSGDCHSCAALGFRFDETLEYLKAKGFETVAVFDGNGFRECKID